jgi:hypothetical protein
MENVIILDSARKHGINDTDILYVLAHAVERIAIDGENDKYLYFGFNAALNELEVVTVEIHDENIIVIHAMKARKSTIKWIEELRHGQ